MSGPEQNLLLYVAAHEVVLAEQAAALLEITEQDATERLEQLRTERLVTSVTLRSRLPPAYRITRDGVERIDSYLPPLRALDMARYRHEIALAWLWASGRHGNLGNLREILSRREMQAADTTLRSESLLDTPGATFGGVQDDDVTTDARHAYPDLGLVQATGGWATLDLVLTRPAPHRINAMISRLNHHPQILAELYFVEQHTGIDQAIKHAAEQNRISDKVHVQFLATDGIAGV
jgi:hypothetical protein